MELTYAAVVMPKRDETDNGKGRWTNVGYAQGGRRTAITGANAGEAAFGRAARILVMMRLTLKCAGRPRTAIVLRMEGMLLVQGERPP